MDKSLELLLNAAKEVGGVAWPILVHQRYVVGMLECISGALLVVLGITGLCILYRLRNQENLSEVFFFLIGACVIACIFGGSLVYCGVGPVVYPEGAALECLIYPD